MSGDGSPAIKPLPSASELSAALQVSSSANQIQDAYEGQFGRTSVTAETEYAHLRGLRDRYTQKQSWSWAIMGLVVCMVVFQSVTIGLVGAGIWTFVSYKWLLPALLAQNFAQIVTLALVVVKSLFPD